MVSATLCACSFVSKKVPAVSPNPDEEHRTGPAQHARGSPSAMQDKDPLDTINHGMKREGSPATITSDTENPGSTRPARLRPLGDVPRMGRLAPLGTPLG